MHMVDQAAGVIGHDVLLCQEAKQSCPERGSGQLVIQDGILFGFVGRGGIEQAIALLADLAE
jgi:hypothetical protein